MKKLCFIILFLLVISGVFGQLQNDYRWLVGTWVGSDRDHEEYELVLFDNGAGFFTNWDGRTVNIVFSIVNHSITVFNVQGHTEIFDSPIFRVNDQRVILFIEGYHVNFMKRN
ncbi:MAG: hypothetical protein FWG77_02420 [Treponema sp.]|nr:hypothetical protein [Treponema sp.]